jgi:integrase/recombinase XerD
MDLTLWLTRFNEYLSVRNYATRTVESYLSTVTQFLKFLESQSLDSLANLSRQHLEHFRNHLFGSTSRAKPIHVRTQSQKLGAVRCFVKFLVKQDYLLVDPSAALEPAHEPEQIPRTVLSEHETLRLLESVQPRSTLELRDRTILEVLYCTAIRNSELRQLKLEDLDFERHLLRVELGKGQKSRLVPLGEEAEIWLQEYLQNGRQQLLRSPQVAWLFVSSRGLKLSRGSLAQLVTRWAVRAGLSKHATPHILRHSCATHMLRRGAELRHLQVLLGHASSKTTELYTRVELSDLRKVVRRCHPRERRQ